MGLYNECGSGEESIIMTMICDQGSVKFTEAKALDQFRMLVVMICPSAVLRTGNHAGGQ